jgi:urea transport system permease protein
VLVNAAKSWFTGALPEYWLFALGGLFVMTTLLLPKGIVGTLAEHWPKRRNGAAPRLTVSAAAQPAG